MTEDDNLLLKLKDEEGLPWKAIAQRFRDLSRGEFRVPTLQMRYKRLKEKMRVWEVEDVCFTLPTTGFGFFFFFSSFSRFHMLT